VLHKGVFLLLYFNFSEVAMEYDWGRQHPTICGCFTAYD
jgi:hypothetical protein